MSGLGCASGGGDLGGGGDEPAQMGFERPSRIQRVGAVVGLGEGPPGVVEFDFFLPVFETVGLRQGEEVDAELGIPIDNIEGMTFGPPLPDGRQLLVIVSDNNFAPSQFTQYIALALDVVPAP